MAVFLQGDMDAARGKLDVVVTEPPKVPTRSFLRTYRRDGRRMELKLNSK